MKKKNLYFGTLHLYLIQYYVILILLDEMADADPDMMADIYDQQEDLMDNMIDTAFSSASAEDAAMIADIVASGVHGDMAEMMFDNLADMDVDQTFMTEVFYDIAALLKILTFAFGFIQY